MTYTEKLQKAMESAGSCLCVGLDPDLQRIPASVQRQTDEIGPQVVSFLKTVIDQTADACAAYKPNLGFFEALGADGLHVFQEVLDYIPSEKLVIADIKRGDISSTASHYAKAYFETFDVDAVTISPLMGFESLQPFLDYPGKGVYVLTLTSNPGASDFLLKPFEGYPTMASYIADHLARLQKDHPTHLGMVIGATKASSMGQVIQKHPAGALLIPGIGAQGGSIDELKKALENHEGLPLINSSRSILYAGEGEPNWPEAVERQAKEFQDILTPITQQYVN